MTRLFFLMTLPLVLLVSGCASLTAVDQFPASAAALDNTQDPPPRLAIEQWQTEQGSKVLFIHSPGLPMLDVRLVFDAGSARDGDMPGLAAITSSLISEGTSRMDVNDIAQGFEDQGAELSTSSHRDMGVIHLRSLTDAAFLTPTVELFTHVLAEANFPAASLERVRQQRLQGLRMQQQVPGPQVADAFQALVFADHPYAHPSAGTLTSLPAVQQRQVQQFYRQHYAAGNAVIAMVGDIDTPQAKDLAARISEALPQGPALPDLPRANPLGQQQVQHIEFPSSQTHIWLGNQSTWRGNPDHAALHVGNHILGGGGFSSILTDEVRQQRGFVYGISSSFAPMAAGGPFRVQLQTANENADEALTLTLALIEEFVANGPSEAQVDRAKANILGGFPLSIASNRDLIGQLGAIGFYDLPLDQLSDFYRRVQTVTADDIRQAMARHLAPENLAIVSIGPRAPQRLDTLDELVDE